MAKFAPDTFGAWLQTKGFASFKEVPPLYQTAARRLHTGKVAPNSPILPGFAEELGESLATLQRFAKAPPLAPKWVAKIAGQLANGTLPRGAQVAKKHTTHKASATRRGGPKVAPHAGRAGPITQFLTEHTGLSVSAIAKRVHLSPATMIRLCSGQLASNHPILAPFAKAVGVDLHVLAKYMHVPRQRDATQPQLDAAAKIRPLGKVAKATKGEKAKTPGTALVHVPRAEAAERKAAAKQARTRVVKYNKLRSTPLELRDAARMMVAMLNVAAMRGDREMPPLPLRELHLVLLDYLEAKGVRGNVLVDPDFAALFDPR